MPLPSNTTDEVGNTANSPCVHNSIAPVHAIACVTGEASRCRNPLQLLQTSLNEAQLLAAASAAFATILKTNANAAGVLMLLDKIRPDYPVDRAAIQAGINRFRLNGRLQIIPGEVQKVLDVAHNPQAARALAGNLCLIPCVGKTHILIGMLKDKDHRGVLKPLHAVADSWNIVSLAGQRGTPAPALMAELKSLGVSQPVHAFAAVKPALARLGRAARPGDRIVITGSFITVGEALRHFG